MKTESIIREMEKCREILRDRKVKSICKVGVFAYLKSLEVELCGPR